MSDTDTIRLTPEQIAEILAAYREHVEREREKGDDR